MKLRMDLRAELQEIMLLTFITFYPGVILGEQQEKIHECVSMVSFHALASEVELLIFKFSELFMRTLC